MICFITFFARTKMPKCRDRKHTNSLKLSRNSSGTYLETAAASGLDQFFGQRSTPNLHGGNKAVL